MPHLARFVYQTHGMIPSDLYKDADRKAEIINKSFRELTSMKRLLSILLVLTVLISLLSGLSMSVAATENDGIWVDPVNGNDENSGVQASPLKTIEAAKSVAAAASANGNVTVWLMNGVYALSDAITFTSADSGKNGHTITFKPAVGASPVISGGKEVTDWSIYDADKNIYVANVPEGAVNARQFYVDGEHQTRAMTETSPTEWKLFGAKGYMSPVSNTQNTTEYLILDLGEVRNINYLTVYTAVQTDRNGRAAGFPQDFTIEVSTDGNIWTTVRTESGFATPTTGSAVKFDFEAVSAQYVKLNATRLGTASRLNPGKYMLAVSELETGLGNGNATVDFTSLQIDYSTNLMDTLDAIGHKENLSWNDLENCPAGNLFDNNGATYVSTLGYYKNWLIDGGGGCAPYIMTNVSKNGESVQIAAVSMTVINEKQPANFTIEVSAQDNPAEEDWTVITEQTDFDWDTSNTVTFIFSPVAAKKVRLRATDLAKGYPNETTVDGYEYRLALAEFSAYAPKATTEPSETVEIDYASDLLKNGCVVGIFHNSPKIESYNYDEVGTFPLDNLVDDTDGNFITSKSYDDESQLLGNGGADTPWVEVLLSEDGSAITVGAVRLAVRPRVVPNDFIIQASADGRTWKTVVDENDYDWSTEKTQATFTFTPVQATRLRVVARRLKKLVDNEAFYFQLAEMSAYAVKTPIVYDDVNLMDTLEVYGHNENHSYEDASAPVNGNNLLDNDLSTTISTGGYWEEWLVAGGGGIAPWISMNVSKNGESVDVTAVRLAVDTFNQPVSFTIETTEDETSENTGNWTVVYEVTDYDWSNSRDAVFTFQAQAARKVRLRVTKIANAVEFADSGDRAGKATYRLRVAEFAAYAPSSVGARPSGRTIYVAANEGEKYAPVGISALHDNSDYTYAADQAINGMPFENLERYGYDVPESFNLKNFRNTSDMEIQIIRWWYHRILKNGGVSADGTKLYLDAEWLTSYQNSSYADRISWLENAYEFIDQPGEWYIDRSVGKIYYKPEGNMDGKEAVLPVTEQLVIFDNCENIVFDGIKFEHTSWLLPNELGYHDAQSGTYVQHNGIWGDVPGAIETHAAERITITNSELCNLGGGGIRIGNGSSDCSITNNAVHDISSSGIFVGNNTGHNHGSCEPETDVTDILIRNNYVTRTGLDIFDSSAICVLYTANTVIDHNEVCNTSYTGISLGWGWDWKNAPCSGNNTVSNNYIHDTGKTVHDGGCFYSLGLQNGTKVFGNYVHHHSDGLYDKDAGIYTDEGSTGMELYNNVVGDGVYWWRKIWTTSIKDCNWHNNFYCVDRDWNDGTNITSSDNTYVEDGDFSKYAAAQTIIDNAGLTDESVKNGIAIGVADKHDVTLLQYPDCEAYYFSRSTGLLTFTIPNQIGNTQYNKLTRTVNIIVPEGSDLSALAGQYTVDAGFTCDKMSGSLQDFTTPVTYTFTDGEQNYVWTIVVRCEVTTSGEPSGTEMTLNTAISTLIDWTQEPSATENGGTLFTQTKGLSTYIGSRIANDTILEFDMQSVLDGNDWTGYALRMQNPNSTLETMYHVVFKQNAIELQKWVNGERTMLIGTIEGYPSLFGDIGNQYYTSGIRHSIKTGAIDVPTGVRLFLYVDGIKVFDVIDVDAPITEDGFFGVYPMTHDITLYPYSSITQPD